VLLIVEVNTRALVDALWTYVGYKGEKGGKLKKMQEDLFGEEQALIRIPACEWPVQ